MSNLLGILKMTTFFAQPYDLHAVGFYFSDQESYAAKIGTVTNEFGQRVEEFEIQFIDGEDIDAALANAWGVNQANVARLMEVLEEWDTHDKECFIIAVGECGYGFDAKTVEPDDFEVDVYHDETLRDLAERFVDEGMFGDIPERLQFYIDYDAIARDLAHDYTETVIAGQQMVYRCS
jgi:antirestriction protein